MPQLVSGEPQFVEAAVDVVEADVDQLGDVAARWVAVVADGERLGDLASVRPAACAWRRNATRTTALSGWSR